MLSTCLSSIFLSQNYVLLGEKQNRYLCHWTLGLSPLRRNLLGKVFSLSLSGVTPINIVKKL